MQTIKIEAFKVIGIAVRTSNNKGESARDIGALWQRFMSEGILAKIPNRIDDTVYSIYTNYEEDHTKPYDTILGCKVSSLEQIPEGLVGQAFDASEYVKFVCKGDLTKGAVIATWNEIWQTDLQRAYTADFEVYDQRSANPADAEVDVLVAI